MLDYIHKHSTNDVLLSSTNTLSHRIARVCFVLKSPWNPEKSTQDKARKDKEIQGDTQTDSRPYGLENTVFIILLTPAISAPDFRACWFKKTLLLTNEYWGYKHVDVLIWVLVCCVCVIYDL